MDYVKLYSEIKKIALKYENEDLLKFNKYQIISIFHWAISYKYKFLHKSDNELIEFINSVIFSEIYNDLISDNKPKSSFKLAINQRDSKTYIVFITIEQPKLIRNIRV